MAVMPAGTVKGTFTLELAVGFDARRRVDVHDHQPEGARLDLPVDGRCTVPDAAAPVASRRCGSPGTASPGTGVVSEPVGAAARSQRSRRSTTPSRNVSTSSAGPIPTNTSLPFVGSTATREPHSRHPRRSEPSPRSPSLLTRAPVRSPRRGGCPTRSARPCRTARAGPHRPPGFRGRSAQQRASDDQERLLMCASLFMSPQGKTRRALPLQIATWTSTGRLELQALRRGRGGRRQGDR